MRRFFAAVAICSTALSPILATAASAFTVGTATVTDPVAHGADATTLGAMQAQCSSFADANELLTGNMWDGTLNNGSITSQRTAGPTEVGPREIVQSSIVGTGVFTPGTTYIDASDPSKVPFRVGGSVNMFGNQYATAGRYSDSTYNFSNEFTSTLAYSFSCNMTETIHHHDLVTPATLGRGHHYRQDGNEHAQNCAQMDERGDYFGVTGPGPIGDPGGTCLWAWDEEPQPAVYNDYDTYNYSTKPGVAVDQIETDTLSGSEAHGGAVNASGGPIFVAQVVICISPKKLPGIWTTQNGYGGTKCTTDWFKVAPWGAGTNTSNGTYISVPNYSY